MRERTHVPSVLMQEEFHENFPISIKNPVWAIRKNHMQSEAFKPLEEDNPAPVEEVLRPCINDLCRAIACHYAMFLHFLFSNFTTRVRL